MSQWLLEWERRSSPPRQGVGWASFSIPADETHCLWRTGCIANRADLLALTALPAASDDGGLLCALYARFGACGAAERIFGQFAWLLWDAAAQQLVAARDRLGVQTVFFTQHGEILRIADRAHTLLPFLPQPLALNAASLARHLHGLPPRVGETYHAGVSALPPAGLAWFSGVGIRQQRYWSLSPRPPLQFPDDEAYAGALRQLLFEITPGYLSPQPMGILLSSGMDSTSVAAVIRSYAPQANLQALSWATPQIPQSDEAGLAGLAARRLNLPHTVFDASDFWTLCGKAGIETSPDSPFVLFFEELRDEALRWFQQQGIGVVFDGNPGDFLFGENVFPYADLLLAGRWRQMRRELAEHLAHSPRRNWQRGDVLRLFFLQPLLNAWFPALLDRRQRPLPWLHPSRRHAFRSLSERSRRPARLSPAQAQRFDLLTHPRLPQVMAFINQRAADRFGLEIRHPLLDHRLFEFAARLPVDQAMRAGQRKMILRHAMRGLLPDEIVSLRGKITPQALSETGLRQRETAKVWALLGEMRAADLGFVEPQPLRLAYQDYLDGKSESVQFWYALTLEAWLRRYFP